MKKLNLFAIPSPLWEGEGKGGGEGAGETPAPAPEAGQADPATPTDGNGFADISELIGLASDKPEGEPSGDDPSKTAAPEGDKTEQKPGEKPAAAPAVEPGKEKPPQGEQPKPEQAFADALKDVLKEVRDQGKPEEKKPEAPAYKPKYANVNMPDEIFAAIDSDDPKQRRVGLNVAIGAAMTKVYDDVIAEVKAEVANTFKQVPQVIQAFEQQKKTFEAINKDFFGTYKQFDTEPGRKLVAMVAIKTAQEMGQEYKGWNAAFRDKVGQAMIELTGLKTASAAATPETKPNAKPAGQPPAQFAAGGGARPSTGDKTLADEISDVVGSVH